MAVIKNIFWRLDLDGKFSPAKKHFKEGFLFANVHYLVGYNQRCISDYMDMAKELRKTFPTAKNKDLKCRHVSESMDCVGFSLLAWDSYIPLDNNMIKLLSEFDTIDSLKENFNTFDLLLLTKNSELYEGWRQSICPPDYYW